MKRFVSYLYSIYNNQKIHNAGFARIELRVGRNRIEIHLRENGYAGKTGTVYLFIRKQEIIQGVSIGNIVFRNNQADFRYEQAEENIGQTPWQIMQMNGILIVIDDRIAFLSQWDELPVNTERFQIWDKESEDSTSAKNQDAENKSEMELTQELPDQQKNVETQVEDREDDSKNSELRSNQLSHGDHVSEILEGESNKITEESKNPISNKESQKDDTDVSMQKDELQTASEDQVQTASDIQTAELQPQRRNQWEQNWRYMLRMYPVLHEFAEKDRVLCVRIEIKDVRLLPEKYWSVINNSFLLHGFFNYRYLIFGRVGVEQNWFIGIPGIYQNQEHVMASIFGFPDFLPQAEKNERGEQPGYWYRILDI